MTYEEALEVIRGPVTAPRATVDTPARKLLPSWVCFWRNTGRPRRLTSRGLRSSQGWESQVAKRGGDIDWMSVRISLYMRSGGRCEFCRRPLDNSAHIHHRKLRSQGGGHEEENLALICVADHEWAHGNPAAARAHGWIVSGSLEPSETPVVTCSTRMEGCLHGG